MHKFTLGALSDVIGTISSALDLSTVDITSPLTVQLSAAAAADDTFVIYASELDAISDLSQASRIGKVQGTAQVVFGGIRLKYLYCVREAGSTGGLSIAVAGENDLGTDTLLLTPIPTVLDAASAALDLGALVITSPIAAQMSAGATVDDVFDLYVSDEPTLSNLSQTRLIGRIKGAGPIEIGGVQSNYLYVVRYSGSTAGLTLRVTGVPSVSIPGLIDPPLGPPLGGNIVVFGTATTILVGTAVGATGPAMVVIENLGPDVVSLGSVDFPPTVTAGYPIPPTAGLGVSPCEVAVDDVTKLQVWVPAGTDCRITVHSNAPAPLMGHNPRGGTTAGADSATSMFIGTAVGASGSGRVLVYNAGPGVIRLSSAAVPPTVATGHQIDPTCSYRWQSQAVDGGLLVYAPAGTSWKAGVHQ